MSMDAGQDVSYWRKSIFVLMSHSSNWKDAFDYVTFPHLYWLEKESKGQYFGFNNRQGIDPVACTINVLWS
jgi:hypothetical protein